jgi:hypothetical protein
MDVLTQPWTLLAVSAVGLLAGILGGMLGVGGAVVVIPGLTWLFGYNQHIYQATAMITSIAVSIPAAVRHYRQGAAVPRALRWMIPAAILLVLAGVALSNAPWFHGPQGSLWLGRLLSVFLIYEISVNVYRLFDHHEDGRTADDSNPALTGPRSSLVGAVMGLIGGLLGVGGGVVAVPLQHLLLRLPLRSCIANASAVICASSSVGAVYKNLSLHRHGYDWRLSVGLALILAPSCWYGGHLGARLTHSLSIRHVRVAFIALTTLAAYKMAALQ